MWAFRSTLHQWPCVPQPGACIQWCDPMCLCAILPPPSTSVSLCASMHSFQLGLYYLRTCVISILVLQETPVYLLSVSSICLLEWVRGPQPWSRLQENPSSPSGALVKARWHLRSCTLAFTFSEYACWAIPKDDNGYYASPILYAVFCVCFVATTTA